MTHQEKVEQACCCKEAEVVYLRDVYEPRDCIIRCRVHNAELLLKDETDYAALSDKDGRVY